MNEDKKKIILFGAGEYGRGAISQIGDENVYCFCDNNKKLTNTYKFGKKIIAFDELKEIYNDYIIIVCANYTKAYNIILQLEEKEIYDYLPYVLLCEEYGNKEWDYIITDEILRSRIRIQFFRKIAERYKEQVSYFMKHSDIYKFKPATGALRKHQIQEVECLNDILKMLSQLNIKPILYCGNLLGYVRHNGFIPWDDDIDILLIRSDYEKVRNFCIQNIEYLDDTGFRFVENSYDFYFVRKSDDCSVDFFSLDYYKDEYSYSMHRDYLFEIKQKMLSMESEADRIKFVRNELENNLEIVNESSKLYFGIDSIDSYNNFHKGEWIEKDTVFPLQSIEWEGLNIFIPNKPEEFLSYLYKDIYSFPEDAGLQRHYNLTE